MRSSASRPRRAGRACRSPLGAAAQDRFDGFEVADDPIAFRVGLAKVVRRANGGALEDHVGRGGEQDDRVEAVVEHSLVGDAAGDEERFVSVLVQELSDPVFAPQRLGLALDPPAVVRVHDPVPSAGELGERGRLARAVTFR
jgi:hypothetical protein